jgi:hypothetical protein
VTHLNPAKAEPAQNARQDSSVIFGEFEIYGIASIPQRALQDFHSLAREPLGRQIIFHPRS